MNENNWIKIWSEKHRLKSIVLECLVKADGFDSVAGSFSVEHWREYVGNLFALLKIKDNCKVFDVGCGSGAFLYEHYIKGGVVGGVDYSSSLIDIAKGFMPGSDFTICNANKMSLTKKYDVVTSHSVFQYFDNLEMAHNVTKNMIEKSTKTIAILDVNDEKHFDIYHAERINKFKEQGFSENDYWDKYRNLEHLFYTKDFFQDIAIRNNLQISISSQEYVNYGNSKLRFNVVYQKK